MNRSAMNTNDHVAVHPSVGWKCSTCGKLIIRIADGWVEWLASEDEYGTARLKGLRLVHRLGAGGSQRGPCQYDERREFHRDQSIVEGLPLERFVGADGLMLLLSLIAQSEMPRAEVLELAKRVQIPGYEQTRDLFHQAIGVGIVAPLIGEGFYMQSEIQELLRWVMGEVHFSSQPQSET
ncbi:MAG TPA: hypothetical protein VGN86_07140 [Pyrinomonadaceae bacterium]|nr:hypothetical protein [Pyrinomonadaceae bacterium]